MHRMMSVPNPSRWQTVRHELRLARWLWMPFILFIVTRLGIGFVAYLAAPLLNDSVDPPPYHLHGTDNLLLDVFGSRWDTGFYLSIVEEGYKLEGVRFPSTPFFPLLPLLMRGLLPIIGNTAVAGLFVSNLALLLAVILFYRLVSERWGNPVADRAVWYLLIFPTAFFGSAIYTESLFLLCTIGSLYTARNGRWWMAGLLGIAASLTRLVGLITIPMLLAEWLMQRRQQKNGPMAWQGLIAALMPMLGISAYMLYLWHMFGDPLAFMSGSVAWGRVPQSPWLTVQTLLQTPAVGWQTAVLSGQLHLNDWFDLGITILFMVLGLILLYQHRWSEGLFVWLGILIPISSGLLMSQRRYMWVLFPVFILLAQWGKHAWVDRLITTLSLMGLALFTALFANGYWVG